MASTLRLALCQIKVCADKHLNITRARSALQEAVTKGANFVSLPEIWNGPYSNASFPEYAEEIPGIGEEPKSEVSPSVHMMCTEAKALGIWLIGGSISEAAHGKLYNTCVVVNPEGSIVAKHRKVHLFDIDVPGRITFKESDTLTGGSDVTVVDTPWGGVGVGICYDIRFPELAMLMRQRGAIMIVYPGAFNMVTGPAHWELLQRARAVDNQLYIAGCAPARDTDAGYVAWGHSAIVNPWGTVVAAAQEGEEIIMADIVLKEVDDMRQNIPCWKQKRHDIYEVVAK